MTGLILPWLTPASPCCLGRSPSSSWSSIPCEQRLSWSGHSTGKAAPGPSVPLCSSLRSWSCPEHPESGSGTRQGWCHPAPQNRSRHPSAVAQPGHGGAGRCQALVLPWHPVRAPAGAELPECLPRLRAGALTSVIVTTPQGSVTASRSSCCGRAPGRTRELQRKSQTFLDL